jgi:hypothetical protein
MTETRCRSRRARAALLWGLTVFLLGQITLNLLLTWARPDILNPVYGARLVQLQRFLRGQTTTDRPLILMLGSSRTNYGIDAARMEAVLSNTLGRPVSAFNFGTLGGGPVTELLHLECLLAAGIKPNLLLIEVLPPFLAGQLPVPPEARWLPQSSRLSADDRALLLHYGYPVAELRRTQQLSWTIPIYAHRSALLSRLLPCWLPYAERLDWAWNGDEHGWTALPKRLTPQRYQESLRIDRDNFAAAFTGYRVRGAPAEALCRLLETCRQHQIPALAVLMPEGKPFHSWYSRGTESQVEALQDEVMRRYGVQCIDAREWAVETDFFDAHHLAAAGAMRFTDRLSRSLIMEPGWLVTRERANR